MQDLVDTAAAAAARKCLANKAEVYRTAGWKVTGVGKLKIEMSRGQKKMVVKIDEKTMVISTVLETI